jgi:hypothetical protein
MKTRSLICGAGLALALAVPGIAAGETPTTQPTAFQETVLSIANDRAGVVDSLAEQWGGGDARAVGMLASKLDTLIVNDLAAAALAETWEAFAAAAGIGPDAAAYAAANSAFSTAGLTPTALPPPEFGTKLEYTAIEPCRVLDTRNWNNQTPKTPLTVPGQHAVEVHLSNVFGDIPKQGGDPAGCPNLPNNAAAYAVTLTAVSPGFSATPFPGIGFSTLLPYDFAANWTVDLGVTQPPSPAFNGYFTYDLGTFQQAATLVYETGTDLIANTTVVAACDGCTWHTWLYTSGTAHYVMDVVGYFDETVPCDVTEVYSRGLCYETVLRPGATFQNAMLDCALNDGRLPSLSELWPMSNGGLNLLTLAGDTGNEFDFEWVDDASWDQAAYMCIQCFNNTCTVPGISRSTEVASLRYRCVHPAAD